MKSRNSWDGNPRISGTEIVLGIAPPIAGIVHALVTVQRSGFFGFVALNSRANRQLCKFTAKERHVIATSSSSCFKLLGGIVLRNQIN